MTSNVGSRRGYWDNADGTTTIALLRDAVEKVPDRPFLDFWGTKHSYREVDADSTRMANALRALGVEAGQTVVTILENSIDSIRCWFAINKLGAIWVPINTAYTGEFLRHQIVDAGARLIICESFYLDRVGDIADLLPEVSLMLSRGAVPDGFSSRIPVRPLDEHRGTDDTPIEHGVLPASLTCLIYTSGTTGPSKGCMLSHNYMCNLAFYQIDAVPLTPDDVTWTCGPLFHIAATSIVIGTLMAHASIAFPERFSVTGFWDDVEAAGATSLVALASMIGLIAKAPDSAAMTRYRGKVRAVTGAPWNENTIRIWQERFGIEYINVFGYGQTEIVKLGHRSWDEPMPPMNSCGWLTKDFDVQIFDDNDNAVPPGVPGEIVARPRRKHIMFEGYWRRPDATAAVWRNLWMHTGDIGAIDEQGALYFLDRKKDYLRCRGENISSFEVEAAFLKHEAIIEVALHAAPRVDDEDEEIKATFVLAPGYTPDYSDYFRWAERHLPYFAVPRYYECRAELPKNPIGRVLKYQLRDEGLTPETWDSHAAGMKPSRRRAG